jgi:hypothetical protein
VGHKFYTPGHDEERRGNVEGQSCWRVGVIIRCAAANGNVRQVSWWWQQA